MPTPAERQLQRYKRNILPLGTGETGQGGILSSGVPEEGAVPPVRSAGVLGAVVGKLGSTQTAEAIKHITECGDNLIYTLLTFDEKKGGSQSYTQKHKLCPA